MKGSSKIISGLTILLLLAASPKIAVAQSERGTIRGAVTDATGAVVVGATVKAINPETGVESSTVTTAAGLYSIPQLKPGIYRVEVEQASFKKTVRQNVTVNVAATVGLDFQLELGELTQEINVTESAPQLKSETSEVSTAPCESSLRTASDASPSR